MLDEDLLNLVYLDLNEITHTIRKNNCTLVENKKKKK